MFQWHCQERNPQLIHWQTHLLNKTKTLFNSPASKTKKYFVDDPNKPYNRGPALPANNRFKFSTPRFRSFNQHNNIN